jgi:RHS repeat-associated protein
LGWRRLSDPPAARDGNGVAKWDAVWGTFDQLLSWRDLAAHPVGDVAVLPITDHRGSIVGAVESDAGGTTLRACADYTPMGRVATLDPTDDDAETCREEDNPGTRCAHPVGMPFGFAGAWRSEATGLVYMRFRWYSPTLAQFLTPDPMGEVDSWNLYAYVGGDPINRWDPWGLDASSMANAALDGKALVDPSNTGAPVDHGGEPPPPEQSWHSMMPGVGPGHGGPRPPGRMPPPDPRTFPGPDVPRPPMTEPIPLRPVPIAEPPTTSSRVLWCFAAPVNLAICLAAFIPASEAIVDPPADAVPLEAGPASEPAGPGASLRELKDVQWGTYCRTGCEDIAQKIKSAIGGKIYRLNPALPGGRFLGPRNGKWTDWQYHEVVVKDGRVYDTMTGPEGVEIDEFKQQWEYADDIDFGF